MKRSAILLLALLLLGCEKTELSPARFRFTVRDEDGQPVANAKIVFHPNQTAWARQTGATDSVYTDANGEVFIPSTPEGVIYFNITSGERHNRFTTWKYGAKRPGFGDTRIDVTIRPYTEWERILGGGDHLAWKLLKLKNEDGVPLFDYPVVTDMYMDGRWYDSNGRLGLWWFSPDESRIYYDYAQTGAVVASDMIELRDDFFQARIDFFGIVMIIEMAPA